VGDLAPLFDADDDQARAAISRTSPVFRTPDGRSSGPLASRRITRRPLELERRGATLVVRDAAGSAVEVNGQPLAGERTFDASQIAEGLVVLVGNDLVLWIGWVEAVDPAPPVAGLVGESSPMRLLRQQIHRVAELDVPVLLRGETGAGKELVAAAIHRYSRRARARYVAVNVAGLAPSIAASELFGHRRGAFTGAFEERKGYFAQADGGTLFLDEIGDAATEVQALLLRVVQEGEIQPVGGNMRRVDVRLVAATDSDLEAAVVERKFREPLWRRFSYEIHVPPLRARQDDVGILFLHLLRERLEEMGAGDPLAANRADDVSFVPARLIAEMARCRWPGNVRELANVALKFAIDNRQRPRGRVTSELLAMLRARRDEAIPRGAPPVGRRSADLPDTELMAVLRAERYSTERTARRLGISKSYLYKRLGRNPEARRARDLSSGEIQSALAAARGNLPDAAARLQISERALRLHLRRLGLSPPLRF
jgi:two-component system nitrogen regulation response regulator GlnG